MGSREQGADATDGRWLTILRTLCFVTNGQDVLLMKRAAHKRIFPNRYNGVGGHIEHDEDPLTGARREILEETGLVVNDMRLRAVSNIDLGEAIGILLFIFTAISQSRNVTANAEGTLHWIPRQEVLKYDLVEDIPYILPRILAMQPTDAPLFLRITYDENDQLNLCFAEA